MKSVELTNKVLKIINRSFRDNEDICNRSEIFLSLLNRVNGLNRMIEANLDLSKPFHPLRIEMVSLIHYTFVIGYGRDEIVVHKEMKINKASSMYIFNLLVKVINHVLLKESRRAVVYNFVERVIESGDRRARRITTAEPMKKHPHRRFVRSTLTDKEIEDFEKMRKVIEYWAKHIIPLESK